MKNVLISKNIMSRLSNILLIVSLSFVLIFTALIFLGNLERQGIIEIQGITDDSFKQKELTDDGFVNGVNNDLKIVLFIKNYVSSKFLDKAKFLKSGDDILEIKRVENWGSYAVLLNTDKDIKNFEYPNKVEVLDDKRENLYANDYIYQVKMKYQSKVFRHSDIYRVYPNVSNIPEYIKTLEFEGNGSPYGRMISSKFFNAGDNALNISYILKLDVKFISLLLVFIFIAVVIVFQKYLKLYIEIILMWIEKVIGRIGNVYLKILNNLFFKKLRYILFFILLSVFFILFRPAYDLKEIGVENHDEIKNIYISFTSERNKIWSIPLENDFYFRKGMDVGYYSKVIPDIIDKFYVRTEDIKNFNKDSLPKLKISSSNRIDLSEGEIIGDYIVYKKWSRTILYNYFYMQWNIFKLLTAFLIVFIFYKLRKVRMYALANWRNLFSSIDTLAIFFVAIFYTFLSLLFWNNLYVWDLFQQNIVDAITSKSDFYNIIFFTSRRISNVLNAALWCVFKDYGAQSLLQLIALLSFIIILNMIMKKSKINTAVRTAVILIISFIPDIYNLTVIPHSNNLIPFIFIITPLCVFAYFYFDRETKYWNSAWIKTAFVFSIISFYTRVDGLGFMACVFAPSILFIKKEWKKTFIYASIFLLFMAIYIKIPDNDKWREQVTLAPFAYYMAYKSDKMSVSEKEYFISVSQESFHPIMKIEILSPNGEKISGVDYIKYEKGLMKKYPLEYLKFRIDYLFIHDISTGYLSLNNGMWNISTYIKNYHVPFSVKFDNLKSVFTNSGSLLDSTIIKTMKSIHLLPKAVIYILLLSISILFIVLLCIFPKTTLTSVGILSHIFALALSIPMMNSFYYADIYFWIIAIPVLFYCEYINKQFDKNTNIM